MMQKVNKNTVKKQIRETGSWVGYIAPCNVNPWHITNGWHIEMSVTVNSIEQLNNVMRDYAYYNCNSELGNTPMCYQDKS